MLPHHKTRGQASPSTAPSFLLYSAKLQQYSDLPPQPAPVPAIRRSANAQSHFHKISITPFLSAMGVGHFHYKISLRTNAPIAPRFFFALRSDFSTRGRIAHPRYGLLNLVLQSVLKLITTALFFDTWSQDVDVGRMEVIFQCCRVISQMVA